MSLAITNPRSFRDDTLRSRLAVLTHPELEELVIALQAALAVMCGQLEAAGRV